MSTIGQSVGKLIAVLGMVVAGTGAVGCFSLFVAAGQTGSVLGKTLPSGIHVAVVYAGLIIAGAAIRGLGTFMADAAAKGNGTIPFAIVSTLAVLGAYVALHQVLGGAPIKTLTPEFLTPGSHSGGCAPELSVEPIQAQPGQMLTVVGHCYPAAAPVATYVDNHKLDSAGRADTDGNVTLSFRLTIGSERAFPGMHSVQVRVVNTDTQASDAFRVVA